MIHPIPGARVSQRFGENPDAYAPYGLAGHEGPDLAVPVGTPARAAHDGAVVTVRGSATYGNYVTWFGNVYMNPPYGREISRWVDKAYASYRKGDVNAVIALLPARPDTYWFLKLSNFHCCFIMGRLKFVGATSSAPFPSAAFFIGDYPETFDREFSKIGNVYALVRGWG